MDERPAGRWPHVVGVLLVLAAYNFGVMLLQFWWPWIGFANNALWGLIAPLGLVLYPVLNVFVLTGVYLVVTYLPEVPPTRLPRPARILIYYLMAATLWFGSIVIVCLARMH